MVVESQTHTASEWNGFRVVRIRKIRWKSIFLLLEFTPKKLNFLFSTFVQAHGQSHTVNISISRTSVTFFNYWNAVLHFSLSIDTQCDSPFWRFMQITIWCFCNAWYFEATSHLSSLETTLWLKCFKTTVSKCCSFVCLSHIMCIVSFKRSERVCVRVFFFRILIKNVRL